MKNIKVELLHISPLYIASKAIRKCHANEHLSDTVKYEVDYALDDVADFSRDGEIQIGPKDRNLIHRVGLKHDHSSTLEHITVNLDVTGISVAVLGQLTRHRLSSYTVQSTRYTTDKLLNNSDVVFSDVCVVTGNSSIDDVNKQVLRALANSSITNDELRYALPQAWRTNLTMTINFRSLRNLLALRTSSHAMLEIRHLAHLIYNAIPEEYHYLLEDCIIEPDPLENQSC